MVEHILRTQTVRSAIRREIGARLELAQAARGGAGRRPPDRRALRRAVIAQARRHALEIAANYSQPFISFMALVLKRLWTKLYDGVELGHVEKLAEAGDGVELIYVPCHRSHMDYLLLSYVIYRSGFAVPHVAAGANLNMPVIGHFLRKGGAFFLRRSLKGDALYAAVFGQYLGFMMARGHSLEYFIEGGRSRTGRMLAPRLGMLSMTVHGYLREPRRPVVFVPVYFGYERIVEGATYIGELSGRPKEKESVIGLVRSLSVLRRRFGRVHVNLGQPIVLDEVLQRHHPQWRAESRPTVRAEPTPRSTGALGGESRDLIASGRKRALGDPPVGDPPVGDPPVEDPPGGDPPGGDPPGGTPPAGEPPAGWTADAIGDLARRIITGINGAAAVTPINLVAMALLAAPRQALAESDLVRQLDLYKRLLEEAPYGPLVTVTPKSGTEMVAYAHTMGLLERHAHPLGDILRMSADVAVLATYYRNNILHLFAMPSLLACGFLGNAVMRSVDIQRLVWRVYPYIAAELALKWEESEMPAVTESLLGALARVGLLERDAGKETWKRPPSTSLEAMQLSLLAQSTIQTLERYYLVIALLLQAGSGCISQESLEQRCHLTAQRMSLLYGLHSPEFFDKSLFRNFIELLRRRQVVNTDAAGAITFGEALLGVAADAQVVLSEQIRHDILQVTL
jgi:glycerol-3-phosphate O-acyltransferase